MKKLTNISKYSINRNLQVDIKSNVLSKLFELDSSFIGTNSYMGIAYFWDHDVKYTMRDVSPKFRKIVHDTAIEWGLKFTPSEYKFYPSSYIETTQELKDIINLCVDKFKMGVEYKL